jgi:hypothetical protein
MAFENPAIEPLSTWFLLARSGNLLMRLQNTLRIGEDESGDLVLTPAPSEALLSVSLNEADLQLSCALGGWLLQEKTSENASAGSRSLTLAPGDTVALSLPHNQFTLSNDSIQHSPASRHIRLVVEPDIPTLENVVLPAVLTMTSDSLLSLPADIVAPESKAFLTPILIQEASSSPLLDEIEHLSDESYPSPQAFEHFANDTPRAINLPPITRAESAAATKVFQSNRAGLAVVIAGLVVALYFVVDSQLLNSIRPIAPIGEIRQFNEPTLQLLGSSASPVPAAAEPAVIVLTTPPSSSPSLLPLPSESSTSNPDPQLQEAFENQLAQAERLMAEGRIIEPADTNAIKLLSAILNTDPTNPQGLALIYECAMRLLDQARVANAAGDEFLARNLTEEVLAFHPTLPDALALRSQLWAQ